MYLSYKGARKKTRNASFFSSQNRIFFEEYSETIIFCEIFARVSVKKMDISQNIFLKSIFPLEPLEVLFL